MATPYNINPKTSKPYPAAPGHGAGNPTHQSKVVNPIAGSSGATPSTVYPTMPSVNEVRAGANAEAWKSIQKMIGALPTDQQISGPFNQQRSAIAPLVEAHRAWLEAAGHYQVNAATALGNMVGQGSAAADKQMVGSAAAAGAPQGGGFSANVTPNQLAQPVAYGSNFGSYLSALTPSATAQGIGNEGLISDKENAALTKGRSDRAQISSTLTQTQNDNFTNMYGQAFEQYKSELAALTPTLGKNAVGADGLTPYQRATLGAKAPVGADGLTPYQREQLKVRREAINKPGAAKASKTNTGGQTPADIKSIQLALKTAYATFNKPTGHKEPSRFSVMMTLPGGKDASTLAPFPKKEHPIAANSLDEVKRLVKVFYQQHQGQAWSQGTIGAAKGFTKRVGQAGEANRRMAAWQYVVGQNAALGSRAMPSDALKKLFRQTFGEPK